MEEYFPAFDDALTSWEEVEEPYFENLKKMNFLNGVVDVSYSALYDILMEDDPESYTDCILALRRKAIETGENSRSHCPLKRVTDGLKSGANEGDDQVFQQDIRYLPKKLGKNFNPGQKRCTKPVFSI